MSSPSEPQRLLFVCTANICRSPTAEVIARATFGEHRRVFRSAGFLDEGRGCPPLLIESLRERGLEAAAHRSYRLDQASLDAADLVLTMEGEHVQKATLLSRASYPKVIPLKEAAAHLDQAREPSVAIGDLVARVNDGRDPASYLSNQWDVDDPYGGKARDYRRAVDEIASLVEVVLGRLD